MSDVKAYGVTEDIQVGFVLRQLVNVDKDQVNILDGLSGNRVINLLDDEPGIAWGIFRYGRLLGYCTIGGVEGTEHEKHAKSIGEVDTSCTLCNVYVHPYARSIGFGSSMIKYLVYCTDIIDKSITRFYCTFSNFKQEEFYKKLGFKETTEEGILCYVREELYQNETDN